MSRPQAGRDYKRVTIEKRGRDLEVRVPQFPKDLSGNKLLFAIGRLAMETANKNYDKACRTMEDWFRADYTLYMRTQDLRLLCRSTIDSIRRQDRPALRAVSSSPSDSRMKGILNRAKKFLMDWPLRQGLALRDATASDLEIAAKEDHAKSVTLSQNAKWYALIRKQLPDTKTKVSAVLEEADLARLQKTAQKDAA